MEFSNNNSRKTARLSLGLFMLQRCVHRAQSNNYDGAFFIVLRQKLTFENMNLKIIDLLRTITLKIDIFAVLTFLNFVKLDNFQRNLPLQVRL